MEMLQFKDIILISLFNDFANQRNNDLTYDVVERFTSITINP